MNIKNLTAGIIIGTSMLPLFAYATTSKTKTTSTPTYDATAVNASKKTVDTTKKTKKNFCTEIAKETEPSNKKEITNVGDKTTLQIAKEGKLFGDQVTRDTVRYGGQDDATIKANEVFTKLEAKATTPAKKAALEQYKKTLETALATRKGIITTAKATFKQGTTTSIESRKKELTGEKEIVVKEMAAALAQAKTDCTSGAMATVVEKTYLARIKTAKAELEKIRNLPKTKEIQAQKDTFIKTVKKADADFKTTRGAARATLMLTLGK